MIIRTATPVLMVDRVEPTRDFFRRLGFTVSAEIPDGERLGFSMLVRDGVQVMVETRGNANEEPPLQALTGESRRAVVFLETDDLDAAIAALDGFRVLVARHDTFYGSDEISYEEPGGNVVTIARFQK